MHRDPQNPASNVLYNEHAMAILKDACARLREMGLHCGLGPDAMLPDSDMSVVLRVSTSAQAIDEPIVGSLVASEFALSVAGHKAFDERLAEFRADCAIGKAMDNPGAKGA